MSEAFHILVVDDDRRIRALLDTYLVTNGYRVTTAANAAEARERMRGVVFDLIVLDVMMPGESGVSFAESLRSARHDVPILMLSARAESADRIKGLAAGSDDYLVKPFEPEELLLRVRNLLRRNGPTAPAIKEAQFGDCIFDMQKGELWRGGEIVRLTGREKELLRHLVQAGGKPVSRAALRGSGQDEAARAVDVQINRLRQKIETDPANPSLLQTVRGEGYVLFLENAE
ncbi:response regulator [Aestuariivirga sp.]|uniref:response regulator n=1 Tax=Aestuariivirga sp. TaxID=2650926 RepID=UPI0039E4094B